MLKGHRHSVPLILLVILYAVFQYRNINLDLWNDEIYTLKNFVFVPFSTIVSDYHAPNNHIFFNLVLKCYLSIVNVHSVEIAMDKPYLLRLLPFIFSLGTIVYINAIGKKFFSEKAGYLSIIILITTIPFYNFSLQIRGYGLSMLLIAAILYYSLSFKYRRNFSNLLPVGLLTGLLLYTIPLNLYFAIGFWSVCFFAFLIEAIRNHQANSVAKKIITLASFQLVLTITVGIVLSFGFYLHIFEQVFNNEYVKPGEINFYKGLKIAQVATLSFLSKRYLLIPLLLIGLLAWRKKLASIMYFDKIIIAILLCFIPFFIDSVRGNPGPFRAFANLVPLFVLGLATSIDFVVKAANISRRHYLGLLVILVSYCSFTFVGQQKRVSDQLLSDIHSGRRSQDLYFNYYLDHYQPRADLENYIKLYGKDNDIVILHDSEPHGLPYYLDKYEITYYKKTQLDSIISEEPKELFIITRYPFNLKESLGDKLKDYKFQRISENPSYNNVVRIYRFE